MSGESDGLDTLAGRVVGLAVLGVSLLATVLLVGLVLWKGWLPW